MQNTAMHPASVSVGDNAVLSQIAAIRASLSNQRARARTLWDACAPASEEAQESRAALGRFTEKLLKGKADAAYA